MMYFFSLIHPLPIFFSFFFFNDTATTEIYTLSLHDALPISVILVARNVGEPLIVELVMRQRRAAVALDRSEEHTSELQSPDHLVCRLLLEKKKKKTQDNTSKLQSPNRHRHHLQQNNKR